MKKTASKKMVHEIRTHYLDGVYTPRFMKLVPETLKVLKSFRRKHDFDAIAFTGSSGAALAFPLSFFMKVPLIHVRKMDGSHYQEPIEGSVSSKRYVIVDDMISSGNTINRIIDVINRNYKRPAKAVGICLFNSPPCTCGSKDCSAEKWGRIPIVRVPEVK